MPNQIFFGNELEIFGNSNAICKFDNLKLSNRFKTTTSLSMDHNITVGKDPISRGENQ